MLHALLGLLLWLAKMGLNWVLYKVDITGRETSDMTGGWIKGLLLRGYTARA